jgi:hypothetical protein
VYVARLIVLRGSNHAAADLVAAAVAKSSDAEVWKADTAQTVSGNVSERVVITSARLEGLA